MSNTLSTARPSVGNREAERDHQFDAAHLYEVTVSPRSLIEHELRSVDPVHEAFRCQLAKYVDRNSWSVPDLKYAIGRLHIQKRDRPRNALQIRGPVRHDVSDHLSHGPTRITELTHQPFSQSHVFPFQNR